MASPIRGGYGARNALYKTKEVNDALPVGQAKTKQGMGWVAGADSLRKRWFSLSSQPGDTLTRDGCLAFLSSSIPGLHVGGKTALTWRGIRHNVPFRETIELWGDIAVRIPPWLTGRFPCRYQTTRIFENALPPGFGLSPLPGVPGSTHLGTGEGAA